MGRGGSSSTPAVCSPNLSIIIYQLSIPPREVTMADFLPWILVVVAYLIGGIPLGVLVARSRGINLTQVGSGNIGASNVMRTLGTKLGIAVWLADLLKGLVPVVWARPWLVNTEHPWRYLAAVGLAAVLGHCFSPY